AGVEEGRRAAACGRGRVPGEPMPTEGTIEWLLALAERCRRLAASITDRQTSQWILEVAETCDAVVAELRGKGIGEPLVPAPVTRDATRQGLRASSLSALFGNPPWTPALIARSGGR